MLRKVLLGLTALVVVLQFIRPEKNRSFHTQHDDIFEKYHAPDAVRVAVEHACYDCHSNQTRYPWYAEVQPLGWWLANHVNAGKDSLNFSVFARYDAKRAARKLEESIEQIQDGAMPLPSYTWIHREARLTPEVKKQVVEWMEATQEAIAP